MSSTLCAGFPASMEARDLQKVVHSPTIPPHYVTMSMMQLSYDLNHHTVQVAICAHLFVSTLVNVLVFQGKTPPAQVAVHYDHHECK